MEHQPVQTLRYSSPCFPALQAHPGGKWHCKPTFTQPFLHAKKTPALHCLQHLTCIPRSPPFFRSLPPAAFTGGFLPWAMRIATKKKKGDDLSTMHHCANRNTVAGDT